MKHASTPPWHADEPGREGTPEEFVDWFLSNDRAGQAEIAEWAIRSARWTPLQPERIERWADDHFTQGEVAVVMRLVEDFGWRPPTSVTPPGPGHTEEAP